METIICKKKKAKKGENSMVLCLRYHGESQIRLRRPRNSQIGAVLKVGGEPRGDRWVVHDVVKRRRLLGQQPEPLCFLLREASGSESRRSGRLHLRSAVGFLRRVRPAVGVNVVWLRRPSEERRPPVGAGRASPANVIGLRVGYRGGADDQGTKGKQICGHF